MAEAAFDLNSRSVRESQEASSGLGLDAEQIRRLKARDNSTNWRHLARVWGIVALTFASVIMVETFLNIEGLSQWWGLPVWLAAILLNGASQHQLGGAIHEGTHFLLFENKKLNEVASDWLAAFPIYTSTYQYRVHHLAHHQFVNDPARDPDISQLKDSDHWLDFPVEHIDVLRKLARQLWLPNLFRFTVVRARYSALGHEDNPYLERGARQNRWPIRAGVFFAVAVPFIVNPLLVHVSGAAALAALVVSYVMVLAFFALLPEQQFPQTRLRPVISHRVTAISRMTFLFALYLSLTLYDMGRPEPVAWNHFGRLWALPLFTSFPLFMMVRQWVQHGNADRGRYTNTRVFLAGPVARYAIFPWGMDYHLPHHLLASVPHYRLKTLHELLSGSTEYRDKGVIVEGCFRNAEAGRPTAMSVLTSAHSPGSAAPVYVDNAALEYADVRDAQTIENEAATSLRGPDSGTHASAMKG